jgi:hypothetical protein
MTSSLIIDIVLACISIAALCISLFTYFDNRRRTQIIEKHEHTKEEIRQAREILLDTARHFKQLSQVMDYIPWDFTVDNILRIISERNNVNLRITINHIDMLDDENGKIYHQEIGNADRLQNRLERPFLKFLEGKTQQVPNPTLMLDIDPALDNDFMELGDFFKEIVQIKLYHTKLREHYKTIESFDNSVLDDIARSYKEIFDAFYEAVKRKSYEFQFDRQTRATEIRDALYNLIGVYSITHQFRYLSTNIVTRLGKITGELLKQE